MSIENATSMLRALDVPLSYEFSVVLWFETWQFWVLWCCLSPCDAKTAETFHAKYTRFWKFYEVWLSGNELRAWLMTVVAREAVAVRFSLVTFKTTRQLTVCVKLCTPSFRCTESDETSENEKKNRYVRKNQIH